MKRSETAQTSLPATMSWPWWPKVRPGVKNHHPETISTALKKTAAQIMQHVSSPARVVVFGSYGRGDATQDSDLDLLVIQKSVDDFTKEYTRLR